MNNAEVARRLLELARELSPLARVIVAVIPSDEKDDEAVVDMTGANHEDVAQVISELAFWLSDDWEQTHDTDPAPAEQPS